MLQCSVVVERHYFRFRFRSVRSSIPPRPCASRRVVAFTKFQTLQTSQNLKQAHKGEGLPSPFPLPDGPAQRAVRFLNPPGLPLNPSKRLLKPALFQNFRFLAPPSPLIYQPHLPSKLFGHHFSFFNHAFNEFSKF